MRLGLFSCFCHTFLLQVFDNMVDEIFQIERTTGNFLAELFPPQ